MSDTPTAFPLDRARRIAAVVKQVEGLPVDLVGGPRRRPPDQGDSTGNNIIKKMVENGIAPQRIYTIGAEWLEPIMNGVPINTPTAMEVYHGRDAVGTVSGVIGMPSPVFGRITNLDIISTKGLAAGTVKFKPFNVTTASMVDAPEEIGLTDDASGQDWDDGLAVNLDDKIVLRYELSAGNTGLLWATATFTFEEQVAYEITGNGRDRYGNSPNGVVIRKGQFGGKPAFQTIDEKQWLFWEFGGWNIDTAKPIASPDVWHRPNVNPVGAYLAVGTATGTPTVAAYPG